MTAAYEFGRWVSRLFRSTPPGGALILLLVGAVAGSSITLVALNKKAREVTPAAAPLSPTGLSQEEIARVAARHQAQAEAAAQAAREEEARRQRERDQQDAMDRSRKAVLDKSRANVKACASTVRQRMDARIYQGASKFDAYVTGEYGENVSYFGSAEERFQFEKCMADRGAALSTENSDSKKK